jgi:hypothetical protein
MNGTGVDKKTPPPLSKGAYQTELKGEADAFIAKFTPD